MKTLKIFGFLLLTTCLASCVTSKRFVEVESERNILKERVKELEEEIASKENLIYFLEREIQYVQRENKERKR